MKFNLLLTKLWMRTENALKFRHTNDNYSSTTYDYLMKLYMHYHTMVIYTQYKFNKIPSVAYKVIAEDGNKCIAI